METTERAAARLKSVNNSALPEETRLSPEGQPYMPLDGIYIHPNISESKLEGFNADPIVDATVSKLGAVCLEAVRVSGGKKRNPTRAHRLYTVQRDGYRNALEITDPVEGEADYTIFSLPGLTEHIEGGIRKQMQNRLSYRFPNARIVSIASDGIGPTGDRYDTRIDEDREKHSFGSMASQRLSLARAVSGDKPVITMATSMGGPIEIKMVNENFYGEPEDNKVNIVGRIAIVSAALTPQRIVPDMAFKFLPKIGLGLIEELVLKSSPKEVVSIVRKGVLDNGFSKRDVPVIWHQIYELLKGTPEDDIYRAIVAAPTLAITGSKDALRQDDLMERQMELHGDRLVHVVIEGRGHELPMKPIKICNKAHKAGQFMLEAVLNPEPPKATKPRKQSKTRRQTPAKMRTPAAAAA